MQVEWTPYMTSPRALLNEHPRTTFIGGITCFDIVEVYLPDRTVRQVGFVQAIRSPPMRPAKAVRPAHGTYSVTFASPPVYLEAWSRFPYSARLGDQALRRASVPSEADPSYVDWFKVCSHPYVVPGEGLSAGFGPAESRLEYISFLNLFIFYYVVVLFRCIPW